MINKILLPIDDSEQSAKTVEYAFYLAKVSGAPLIVMHAYEPMTTLRKRSAVMAEELRASLEEEAKTIVSTVTERASDAGFTASALVVEGTPAEAILRAVEEEKPDIVVMGSRGGGGLPGLRFGGVADRVVRHSPVPVLVVK